MNKEIQFNLTIDEANLVLTAAARMPYEQVFQLIEKLKSQAQQQLETVPNNLQKMAAN